VDLDAPAQDEVAAGSQRDEERAEDDEVDVEPGRVDVELAQHVIRLVEDTLSRVVVVAVEWRSVEPVDRLQHALERVPAHSGVNPNIFGVGGDRGAEGWVWGGGVPLLTGEGVWGGGTAPFPRMFLILDLKIVNCGAFLVQFFCSSAGCFTRKKQCL